MYPKGKTDNTNVHVPVQQKLSTGNHIVVVMQYAAWILKCLDNLSLPARNTYLTLPEGWMPASRHRAMTPQHGTNVQECNAWLMAILFDLA